MEIWEKQASYCGQAAALAEKHGRQAPGDQANEKMAAQAQHYRRQETAFEARAEQWCKQRDAANLAADELSKTVESNKQGSYRNREHFLQAEGLPDSGPAGASETARFDHDGSFFFRKARRSLKKKKNIEA